MHIGSLEDAVRLKAELTLWRAAEERCDPNIFKQATLRITDASHGHHGQNGETVIGDIAPDRLLIFVRHEIDRIISQLRALGVEM
jgi:hypothetical protein